MRSGREYSDGARVSESFETLAGAQDLAEVKPQLTFFVVVTAAFDLGDEDSSVRLPGEVVAAPNQRSALTLGA